MIRKFIQKFKKENAQSTVEFALVLPILLLLVLGIIEMGHLLFVYSSVVSASREGARYAASVGEYSGEPRYQDCDGIRDAAMKMGSFAGLDAENDIRIFYDDGTTTFDECITGDDIRVDLKDRVVVSTTIKVTPIAPLFDAFFPEGGFAINSVTGRTLIKDVGIQGTVFPTDTPAPTPTPVCPPTALTTSSEDNTLTVSIPNPDIEHVYYLREIKLEWPGGAPRLETLTFTSPYTSPLTLAPADNPPKYHVEPDDPDVQPFIWYGRFANPGSLIFTFDEDLSTDDLYQIRVLLSLCPWLSSDYVVP